MTFVKETRQVANTLSSDTSTSEVPLMCLQYSMLYVLLFGESINYLGFDWHEIIKCISFSYRGHQFICLKTLS